MRDDRHRGCVARSRARAAGRFGVAVELQGQRVHRRARGSAGMNRAAMRIALFTHSVNPRGGVVHTLELARALHDAGHRVTIFAPSVGGAAMFRASPCRIVLARVAGNASDTVSMVRTRIDALKAALLASD